MFFMRKSNVLFRNYSSFGYLTDNRNFGYRQTNNNEDYIGDKILSESGAVFMSVLNRQPQNIDKLAIEINKHFSDVDFSTLKMDASEFYFLLEQDGFIVSGETIQECKNKDIRFSYKHLKSETKKEGLLSASKYPAKSTQDFFEEYFQGKPQLTNLHIEITSRCNERCIHCYIPHDEKLNQMETNLFYDILKQCVEMRLLNLTLSGGEPMLHSDFCNFLRKCNEYEFSVNVLSNLTLLDDEIIKEMKRNPLLSVQVSLYSMNPSIHDEITQVKGSFEKTKDAILKLIENDIPLQISCPIMRQNKKCYAEVKKWAEMHKVHVGDDFGIIADYSHTAQNLNCRLSISEIREVINDKVESDKNYLEQIELAAEKKKSTKANDFVCSICRSTICITDTGKVYPCEGWQDNIVGNLKESSLKDIWDCSDKVKFLRSLRNQDFPKCIQCTDKEFCTMCMVRNANEDVNGDPLVVNDFFCGIAKLNKEIVLKKRKSL